MAKIKNNLKLHYLIFLVLGRVLRLDNLQVLLSTYQKYVGNLKKNFSLNFRWEKLNIDIQKIPEFLQPEFSAITI